MRELVTNKTGRPPKQKTVEKRVQALLEGDTPPVKKIGRPAKTYEQRPEHIRYIIDCAAIGYSPTKIVGLLQERYGDAAEVVTVSTIKSYIKRYILEINKREVELRNEINILNPVMRVRYLQKVIDEAFAGQEIFDRMGNSIGVKKDHSVIVQAIKEMNAMQKDIDAQKPVTGSEARLEREMNEQKLLIDEYVTRLAEDKNISKLEAIKLITEEFKDYTDVIEQLKTDYKM